MAKDSPDSANRACPSDAEIAEGIRSDNRVMDALEAGLQRSPELCAAFAKRHFGVEHPSGDQLGIMFAAMRLFCARSDRLPSLSVESDFGEVVEHIEDNAHFLRELCIRMDAVDPRDRYGPIVRRLAEKLSHMRKIPVTEFLEAVQEAAVEFGMEHEGRAPNPNSERDLEAIAVSYLPEELAKRK